MSQRQMYCVVYPKRKKINKIVEYKLQAGTGFQDCCPKFSFFFFGGGGGGGGAGGCLKLPQQFQDLPLDLQPYV